MQTTHEPRATSHIERDRCHCLPPTVHRPLLFSLLFVASTALAQTGAPAGATGGSSGIGAPGPTAPSATPSGFPAIPGPTTPSTLPGVQPGAPTVQIPGSTIPSIVSPPASPAVVDARPEE